MEPLQYDEPPESRLAHGRDDVPRARGDALGTSEAAESRHDSVRAGDRPRHRVGVKRITPDHVRAADVGRAPDKRSNLVAILDRHPGHRRPGQPRASEDCESHDCLLLQVVP